VPNKLFLLNILLNKSNTKKKKGRRAYTKFHYHRWKNPQKETREDKEKENMKTKIGDMETRRSVQTSG
jgi:hypothetical protein